MPKRDLRLPWKRVVGGIKTNDGYWVMREESDEFAIVPGNQYMDFILKSVNSTASSPTSSPSPRT